MGCQPSSCQVAQSPSTIHAIQAQSPVDKRGWTGRSQNTSNGKLQKAVEHIFGRSGERLCGLDFAFSIADPSLDGCPLLGCSVGFTNLCGYELHDIVGRNCLFMADSVPSDKTNTKMRTHASLFCDAVARGQSYRMPEGDYEPWMPEGKPPDELFTLQTNARKDGTLFKSMIYMKVFELGSEMGKERPYVVVLQSQLFNEPLCAELAETIDRLQKKMAKLKSELAGMFFMRCSISRHSSPVEKRQAPAHLHSAFDCAEVKPWEKGRFKQVRKLADASSNQGSVYLMKDAESKELLAVKAMPKAWTQGCYEDFLRSHPDEEENPWVDIGCTRFLNSVSYPYVCPLEGVYRSNEETYVVTKFAQGGDLFERTQTGEAPGSKRESVYAPIVVEVLSALQYLHEMEVVHRDISLENVLLATGDDPKPSIKIIDFGMASTGRMFQDCPRGKASYEAPEMRTGSSYDGFLTDTFSAGVLVYSLLLKDYPWLSTRRGKCRQFEFFRRNGLRAYCASSCVRGGKRVLAHCISEPLMQLLEGMLCIDPKKRLSLGEKQWSNRKSVWDEPWVMRPACDLDGIELKMSL